MMELEGMRQTCPIDRHRHVYKISARVSIPVSFPSSSFEMAFDQLILRMRENPGVCLIEERYCQYSFNFLALSSMSTECQGVFHG